MAFDEGLADRVREQLSDRAGLSERKMFGGIGFMIEGNMAVGVMDDAGSDAISEPDGLREWVEAGADYAASLPPK